MKKTLVLLLTVLFVMTAIGAALAYEASLIPSPPPELEKGMWVVFTVGDTSYYSAPAGTEEWAGHEREADVAPFVLNGRTMVPVRYLAYALGASDGDVTWDEVNRTIKLRIRTADGSRTAEVVLKIGSNVLLKDSSPVTMDVTPVIRNGRTFLPARFVAEAAGYEVGWDETYQGVLVGPPGKLPVHPKRTTSLVSATGVIAVAAGDYHTVALKKDGTVWAWGWNVFGELGDGTKEDRLTPVQVKGLTDVIAIAAGWHYTVALKKDGTVWAWGWNYDGQLGDGTKEDKLTPVQVKGFTDVIAIAAGFGHTVALKKDGTVWAWGGNGWGQLGDGTPKNRPTPVQVKGLTDVIAIAAGVDYTVALKKDGTVWAWGWNRYGQLGDGKERYGYSFTPVQVKGLTDVITIAAGGAHTVALKKDGTVWAWGLNSSGQLGDGTIEEVKLPVQVVWP